MDDLRVATLYRALRMRRGWRQVDVSKKSGVSQQQIAVLEAGRLEELSLRTLRAVGAVLEIRLPFEPRWRGGDADRLLDEHHAGIVNAVAAVLRSYGWEVLVEYTFSHYGERGSIDIVAWHSASRALLVVEVKTRVYDTQQLLIGLDRKARLAPQLLACDHGWRPVSVARVLALTGTTANRNIIRRFEHSLGAALPAPSRRVRSWIRRPAGDLAGIWFLSYTGTTGGKRVNAGLQRVRRPRPRSAPVPDGTREATRPT